MQDHTALSSLQRLAYEPAEREKVQSDQELLASVDPDGWVSNGGTSSIGLVGSMMIVTAPDSTHQQVEILLINLAKMNPKNVEVPMPTQLAIGGSGGMGLGGGMGAGGQGGMF